MRIQVRTSVCWYSTPKRELPPAVPNTPAGPFSHRPQRGRAALQDGPPPGLGVTELSPGRPSPRPRRHRAVQSAGAPDTAGEEHTQASRSPVPLSRGIHFHPGEPRPNHELLLTNRLTLGLTRLICAVHTGHCIEQVSPPERPPPPPHKGGAGEKEHSQLGRERRKSCVRDLRPTSDRFSSTHKLTRGR